MRFVRFLARLQGKFWLDNSIGRPLVELVNLENRICDPDICISSVTICLGGIVIPSLILTDSPDVAHTMTSFRVDLQAANRLVWMPFSLGNFSCNLLYKHLGNSSLNNDWNKMLWSNYIPPSRFFFRRLPIGEVFRHQGFSFPSRCLVCKRYEETISHFFVSCPFDAAVWDFISSRFG